MQMPSNNDEELVQLRATLARVSGERDAAQGEVRVLRVERDLLKERLNAFLRKLFAATSEARGTEQRDLFFNEAEALALPTAAPAEEIDPTESVQVPAHTRTKRGRKPLDPALPREVVRHELPEGERACPKDGATLQAIGVEASEQLDIIPQQVRVIQSIKEAQWPPDRYRKRASHESHRAPRRRISTSDFRLDLGFV